MTPTIDAETRVSARLEQLRGGARRRRPTVRALAAFAGHTDCNLAALGFGVGVDFDRLLRGTEHEPPFGQSPFAFSRGVAFERMLAERGYELMFKALEPQTGAPVAGWRAVNLREGFPRAHTGMPLRAQATRALVRKILDGAVDAPNLIDGAVLVGSVGGTRAHFEADALAAQIDGRIRVGEVKSFPVVDGRADPDQLAGALDQVAIYILLARRTVDALGGDADRVSADAMLITPKNVGLTPIVSVQNVERRIARVEQLLARVPSAADVAAALPEGLGFGAVAEASGNEPARRVDALHALADTTGTAYRPECLSTCGNAQFCRERAFRASDAALCGPQLVRLLPGVRSLGRAGDLARGAAPSPAEAAVAAQLSRATQLYDAAVGDAVPARRSA